MKPVFTFIAFLFTTQCFAQRQNVYFLKNNGKYVKERDSADFIRVVREPDSASTLYNVFEFYSNGKNKLLGKSSTIENLELEGQCIKFYPSGIKKSIVYYKGNVESGLEYDYFPNGKPYQTLEYTDNNDHYGNLDNNLSIKANYDSLGKVLVENGNGYFKGYDDDFKYIDKEGPIKNGKKDGTWKGLSKKQEASFKELYEDGKLISGNAVFDDGQTAAYKNSQYVAPQFKGGVEAFGRYLSRNINYPDADRRNGTQGTAIVYFVVEKDGKISDVKIEKNVSPTIDAEAIRVIQDSPKWLPGTAFGRPARVEYDVPINFSLKD